MLHSGYFIGFQQLRSSLAAICFRVYAVFSLTLTGGALLLLPL